MKANRSPDGLDSIVGTSLSLSSIFFSSTLLSIVSSEVIVGIDDGAIDGKEVVVAPSLVTRLAVVGTADATRGSLSSCKPCGLVAPLGGSLTNSRKNEMLPSADKLSLWNTLSRDTPMRSHTPARTVKCSLVIVNQSAMSCVGHRFSDYLMTWQDSTVVTELNLAKRSSGTETKSS